MKFNLNNLLIIVITIIDKGMFSGKEEIMVKVKVLPKQAMTAQGVSRGIALLFHDLGT